MIHSIDVCEQKMGSLSPLGANWSEIIERWYIGNKPSIPAHQGWEALCTLDQLLPDEIERFLSCGVQGPSAIGYLINLGIILKTCEGLIGFNKLLNRMKKGERAAFSEALIASELVKIGYPPELEPLLNGKRPDALIRVRGKKVYIEVITPEESDKIKNDYSKMEDLTKKLIKQNPGTIIDIYLKCEPSSNNLNILLDFIKNIKPFQYNKVIKINNIAFLRYIPHNSRELPNDNLKPVSDYSDLPTLLAAGIEISNGIISKARIGLPVTDDRVERLMADESQHFLQNKRNLLVMDVSKIPGAMQTWVNLIQRRFQPTRNRRFGAVVLLAVSNPVQNDFIKKRLYVLENPYTYKPLPKILLKKLMKLNNS